MQTVYSCMQTRTYYITICLLWLLCVAIVGVHVYQGRNFLYQLTPQLRGSKAVHV